jgi:ankyrin repeat protein
MALIDRVVVWGVLVQALHSACGNGHIEIAMALMDKGRTLIQRIDGCYSTHSMLS